MDARRSLIADACLTLVGAHGVRGLTHHKIDDEAGIARGSTSYYCRRRVDILRLALERLYERDVADLEAMIASIPAGEQDRQAAVTEAVADLALRWLDEEHRPRSIARIELFMAASHEPELQPVVGEQFAHIAAMMQPLEAPASDERQSRIAATFMVFEGLMLMVLRQGLPTPPRERVVELIALVARHPVRGEA